MNPEADCYWMTDQLFVILNSIPESGWTQDLSLAADLRQDFHDQTCRWETRRDGDSQAESMGTPDPAKFRARMVQYGFVFDVAGKSVEYRPTMAKGKS